MEQPPLFLFSFTLWFWVVHAFGGQLILDASALVALPARLCVRSFFLQFVMKVQRWLIASGVVDLAIQTCNSGKGKNCRFLNRDAEALVVWQDLLVVESSGLSALPVSKLWFLRYSPFLDTAKISCIFSHASGHSGFDTHFFRAGGDRFLLAWPTGALCVHFSYKIWKGTFPLNFPSNQSIDIWHLTVRQLLLGTEHLQWLTSSLQYRWCVHRCSSESKKVRQGAAGIWGYPVLTNLY